MKKVFNIVKGIVRFEDKYLFLRAVNTFTPENEGKWECSGGKIEQGEEPEETILREIKEETGLRCEIIKKISILQQEDDKYKTKCHVFLLEADSDDVELSKEHSDFIWLKASEVKNLDLVLFAGLLLEYFNNPDIYLN